MLRSLDELFGKVDHGEVAKAVAVVFGTVVLEAIGIRAVAGSRRTGHFGEYLEGAAKQVKRRGLQPNLCLSNVAV